MLGRLGLLWAAGQLSLGAITPRREMDVLIALARLRSRRQTSKRANVNFFG
jgi:hypothetical protein